ncbi:hypothetical protein [Sphingobacterium hungaricum]
MLKHTTLLFLVAFGWTVTAFAQQKIPFRLTKHNNIIVKALVNKTDSVDLMFQIAMPDASLAPDRISQVESVQFDSTEYSGGLSRNNTVKVGPIEKDGILFFDNEYTGHEAEGKIGTGFFGGKAFKIDYDTNEFVVYDQLPSVDDYDAIPLVFKRGQFFIPANSIIQAVSYPTEFLLQSGYSGSLIYEQNFSDEHQFNDKMTFINEKTLKNSNGQSVLTKNGVIDELSVGEFSLGDVPAGVFVGDLKIQKLSYFGADLLRRFNWIFNADRSIAYIQKSKYFEEAYYILD